MFLIFNRDTSNYQQQVYHDLMYKLGLADEELVGGMHIVSGSKLPSHSEMHTSSFTKLPIQVISYCFIGFYGQNFNAAIIYLQLKLFDLKLFKGLICHIN